VFYSIFTISEKITHGQTSAHPDLDQFHLAPAEDLSPEMVGARPGNVLIPVRDYNRLYNFASVLPRLDPPRQDVVVLHVRVLARAGPASTHSRPNNLSVPVSSNCSPRHSVWRKRTGKPSISLSLHLLTFGTVSFAPRSRCSRQPSSLDSPPRC